MPRPGAASGLAGLATLVTLLLGVAPAPAAAARRSLLEGASAGFSLPRKMVASCRSSQFLAGALEDKWGTPRTTVRVYQDAYAGGTMAQAKLTGSLGKKYVSSWKETAAASGGTFDEAPGLVSHFHMGTCAKASANAPEPPTGTAIVPGETPLNAETTGAHWNYDLSLDYGIRENEMWINAETLPRPGRNGRLRGGQFSELKTWAYPGPAGCIVNPVPSNRGFQGNLPGSYVIHVIDEGGSRPQWACCQLKYTRKFLRANAVSTLAAYVPPPASRTADFAEFPAGFEQESKCESK